MVIRLHNLSARAPNIIDVPAVAELFALADRAQSESRATFENELRQNWQSPGFQLQKDAWVIVTGKGLIVGYADVQHRDDREYYTFTLNLQVHPDYLDRGLGTVLIWLVEERVRQLAQEVALDREVVVCSYVNSLDQWACQTFEREGYALVRRFWRLMIAMEEMPAQSLTEFSQSGRLKVDVVIDTDDDVQHTNMYTANQFMIYRKVLRTGLRCELGDILVMH